MDNTEEGKRRGEEAYWVHARKRSIREGTHLLQLVAESVCTKDSCKSRDESVSKSIRSRLLSNGTWTNKARNWETKEGHRVKGEMNGKVSRRPPRENKLRPVDEGTTSHESITIEA